MAQRAMNKSLQQQFPSQIEQAPAALRQAVRNALHLTIPAAMTLLIAAHASAGPTDGIVVRGAAAIESSTPNTLNINQTSDRAVINWRSFSIGANEQVNFNQPSSTSATLNRVTGGQQSVIAGALNANGNVYLLNASGVLFNSTAKVDVGGLVVTSSEILDQDFMDARLQFQAGTNPAAEVRNEGSITIREGGIAALVAPSVRNDGVIAARAGRVALGAGEIFTLDLYGDQMINFAVPNSPIATAREITQAGSLLADGGRVLVTTDAAAGLVSGVVNMSGITQARSIEQGANCEIRLLGANDVTINGTLDTSGAHGGDIDVFGDTVHLTSGASVDASGTDGGGNVRIGGGFATEDTPRARTTTIDAGAVIVASAIQHGDAGTVAVWGAERAEFGGAIRARGGVDGGNGGDIEVSSRGLLQLLGAVDAGASAGAAGTVLLDPATIAIEESGSSDPTASVIAASALNAMLRAGSSVVLLADNSISVNATIDGRGASGAGPSGRVELNSASIIVMQPILTERNSITLNATSGSVTFGANAFLFVADSTHSTGVGTGAIAINAGNSVQARNLVSLGQVSVTSTLGDVTLDGMFGLAAASATTGIGALAVSAGGNVEMHGVYSNGSVTVNAGGSISNAGASIVASGNVALTAGEDGIAIAQVGTASGIDASGATGVTLHSPGTVTLNSGVRAQNGRISIGTENSRVASLATGTGAVLQAGGDVSAFTNGSMMLHGVTSGGAITLDADGLLTNVESSLIANGAVSLTGGDDANEGVVLANVVGSNSAPGVAVDVTAAGASLTITTRDDVAIAGGVRTNGGNIDIGSTLGRVATLTLESGATLQTFVGENLDGAIRVFSAGDVSARSTTQAPTGLATASLTLNTQTGDVLLDGIFGLANSGATTGVGTVAVQAGGDVDLRGADASGSITVVAGGSINNATASLVADGDVSLSAGADGISFAELSGVAASIDSRGGTVTLNTPGVVTLNSAVRATNGSVSIGSTTPVGSLVSGVTGLIEAGTSVTINASGNVGLHGVTAGGAVSVTSNALLSNSLNAIVSESGPITLVGGSDAGDGIELTAVADADNLPVAALRTQGANAAVTLSAGGDVAIGSGIRTEGGAITLGSADLRLRSLEMAPGATLQTFDAEGLQAPITDMSAVRAGSISAYLVGAVDLSDAILITDDLLIDSTGGNIELGPLLGLDLGSSLSSIPTGIGALTVTTRGVGGIDLKSVFLLSGTGIQLSAGSGGIEFSPDASLPQVMSVLESGDIVLRTPGAIVLNGSLHATRNILIGEPSSPVRSVTGGFASILTQDGNIEIFAGSDTSSLYSVVGGQQSHILIESASSLELLTPSAAASFRVRADDRIVFAGAETFGNVDGIGIGLFVESGGRVEVLGQALSRGGEIVIGRAASVDSDVTINLSGNLLTHGHEIALNGNVILFDGLGRWTLDPDGEGQLAPNIWGLESALADPNNSGWFAEQLADQFAVRPPGLSIAVQEFGVAPYGHNPQSLCSSASNCPRSNPDDADYDDQFDTPDQIELMRFIGTFDADFNLRAIGPDGSFYTLIDNEFESVCGAWICSYNLHALGAPETPELRALQDQADLRELLYQRLLGSLSLRIDTTAAGGAGADVNVSGNLGRFVGADVGVTSADPNQTLRPAGPTIPDGYVNHELVIDVGAGNSFAVAGTFGDDPATVVRASLGNVPGNVELTFFIDDVEVTALDTRPYGLPDVGAFQVELDSGSLLAAGALVDAATVSTVPLPLAFNVSWTNSSPGFLTPGVEPPGPGNFVPPSISLPFNEGSGGIGGGGSTAGAAINGSGAGSGVRVVGVAGSGVVGAGLTVAPLVPTNPGPGGPTNPDAPTTQVLNTAESQSRDSTPISGESASTSEQSIDRCARGAAPIADLGVTRAVDGAATDVFERCPENQ